MPGNDCGPVTGDDEYTLRTEEPPIQMLVGLALILSTTGLGFTVTVTFAVLAQPSGPETPSLAATV